LEDSFLTDDLETWATGVLTLFPGEMRKQRI